MIIKSEKVLWQHILWVNVLTLIPAIILLIEDTSFLPFALLLFGCVFYISVCMAVFLGKTIIMSENGCTLCLWKYQRTYKWEDFKVKRMEDSRDIYHSPTDQSPFSAIVVFSTKNLRTPDIMQFFTYNTFFRPFSFSFFYIYFKVDDMHWHSLLPYPEIYVVDEKEFMEKMQEWGVELEVHTSRGEQYK